MRVMRILFAAGCWLALAAALPLLVSAQVTRDTPATAAVRRIPVGISTISGVVLSAATGRPLRNARVQLSGTAGPLQDSAAGAAPAAATPAASATAAPGTNGSLNLSRVAITDASGRFVFARLAGGRYNLNATRDSFLRFSYGQTRHGRPGTPIVVGDADHVELAIRLERGGVVTGTIFDEDGEPLRSVNVQAWRIVTPSSTWNQATT
jgi:protocatechuate 3,4-dioxygenase beta subunit